MPRTKQRIYRQTLGPEEEVLSDWEHLETIEGDLEEYTDYDAPYGLLRYAVSTTSATEIEAERNETEVVDTRPLYGYFVKRDETEDTVTIAGVGNATIQEETVTHTFDGVDYDLTRLIIGDEKVFEMYITEEKTTYTYYFHIDASDGWLVRDGDGNIRVFEVRSGEITETIG